jgi:SAM-dependent methyltransferase
MIELGFVVDPTDGTPEIAWKAQERISRPVRIMRFEELHASEAYDAVWAHASLLHVPRAGLHEVLERVFRALRPAGVHFANFKGGGAEGRDRFGRYFNYLSMVELLDVYRSSAPWEVLATDEYVGGGYEGRQGPWVAITVRKPPMP